MKFSDMKYIRQYIIAELFLMFVSDLFQRIYSFLFEVLLNQMVQEVVLFVLFWKLSQLQFFLLVHEI
jgi:hypothetical protein